MAEQAGSLSFGFEADFSGFTRAAESAGATLDRLAGRAAAWADTSSAGVTRTFDTAAGLQARQAAAMRAAPRPPGRAGRAHDGAAPRRPAIPDTSGDRDDDSAKVLTRLSEQLALLRTVGDAHAAIAERQKIEVEQAKLGADATAPRRTKWRASSARSMPPRPRKPKLKAGQAATDQAFGFVRRRPPGASRR